MKKETFEEATKRQPLTLFEEGFVSVSPPSPAHILEWLTEYFNIMGVNPKENIFVALSFIVGLQKHLIDHKIILFMITHGMKPKRMLNIVSKKYKSN